MLNFSEKAWDDLLVLWVAQVVMQQVKNVLILIVDRELTAVKFIQSAPLRFQEQAHH